MSTEDFINGPWPMITAWLCFVLTAISTSSNAFKHLLSYSRPDLQPHVLRIIMVAPLYALSAALCLSLPHKLCFFIEAVRDIWEAVVIYSFLTLIIEYMGGEHLCLHSISQEEKAVHHLFPLSFCLPPLKMDFMIRGPKSGALQFVVVKPVVAVLSIVVYASGQFDNPYYQWTLFILYNMSYSVALYSFYLVYSATHEHQALQSKRPLLKFVSVKMIVFLTFWQALLLPHVPLPGKASSWEDFILALEMVVSAMLMNCAFSWREFHSGLKDGLPKSLRFGTKGTDLIDLEATQSSNAELAAPTKPGTLESRNEKRSALESGMVVLKNSASAFCPKDVFNDASRSFSKRYQKHVLIESAQEYELYQGASPPVDLLDISDEPRSANATSAGGAQKTAGPSAGGARVIGRTFRARTYLIGFSMSRGCGEVQGGDRNAGVDPMQGSPGVEEGGKETHKAQAPAATLLTGAIHEQASVDGQKKDTSSHLHCKVDV